MAVLVRVKRKRDELPSDTLIIAAPRMKRERSTKEKLLADFGGMGLEAGARPDASEPVERRCFRRLETLDAAAAEDMERRVDGETAQRLLREARRLRRKRRPRRRRAAVGGPGATTAPARAPQRRRRQTQQLREEPPAGGGGPKIWVDLRDGALERAAPGAPPRSGGLKKNKTSRSLQDLTEADAGDDATLRPSATTPDLGQLHAATRRILNPAERRLDEAVFAAFQAPPGEPAARALAAVRDALDRGAGFARADFRRPSDGTTPLMAAAWHGADGDVARLLGSGADPRVVDASGNDASALAHARGHHGTRNLLLPLDDFVYDVYAYDARADDGDAGDRRPPSPKDAWAPESLAAFPSMGDLSAGGASTQLAPPAPAPPPGEFASADDDDDDDALSAAASSVSSLDERDAGLSDSDRSFDSNDEQHEANDYPEGRDSDDSDDGLHAPNFDDDDGRDHRAYGSDGDDDDDSDADDGRFRARPIDVADDDDMDDTPLGVGFGALRAARISQDDDDELSA
ncbi:transcription factor Iwr1 [Aureococcus anophagefferens]|nr:transcription factor Iwr1 [Aureococcus anophagefferens]